MPSSLDCQIFVALSVDTHLGCSLGHYLGVPLWPFAHKMAKWPYFQMALWLREYQRWVSTEKATKMWQSSEDGTKFRLMGEK